MRYLTQDMDIHCEYKTNNLCVWNKRKCRGRCCLCFECCFSFK
ncbi:hypothetical protein VCRA2128O98_140118 [Vibrio crassostreae]|nr:hypothetical protein VCRA2128O98_140118 [Vibrio crassostreae]CAK3972550.1 hypothetical protein VCRA2128O346_60053 [Vibrio crassostreae]